MVYNICSFKEGKTVEFSKELSKEEFTEIMDSFSDIRLYSQATSFRDMVINNGFILYNLINGISKTDPNDKKVLPDKISKSANKYIFDFASSIVSFIEFVEKTLEALGKERKEDFHERFIKNLHEKNMEYRFWYNMRNYVIHYDFPFSRFEGSYEKGYKIICEKSHLLKYSNWKHARKDIESMSDEIPIMDLIMPMQTMIYAIHLEYVFKIYPELDSMLKKAMVIEEKYNVKNPTLMTYENVEELKKGNLILHPLGLQNLSDAYKDLIRHPNVSVKKD